MEKSRIRSLWRFVFSRLLYIMTSRTFTFLSNASLKSLKLAKLLIKKISWRVPDNRLKLPELRFIYAYDYIGYPSIEVCHLKVIFSFKHFPSPKYHKMMIKLSALAIACASLNFGPKTLLLVLNRRSSIPESQSHWLSLSLQPPSTKRSAQSSGTSSWR